MNLWFWRLKYQNSDLLQRFRKQSLALFTFVYNTFKEPERSLNKVTGPAQKRRNENYF